MTEGVPNLVTSLFKDGPAAVVVLADGRVLHFSIVEVRGSETRVSIRAPLDLQIYKTHERRPRELSVAACPPIDELDTPNGARARAAAARGPLTNPAAKESP